MNLEIRFTSEAEDTYEALVSQLKGRWGDRFVAKLESRITESLNIISSSPYLYPVIDETNDIRRCNLHKNCSMLYRVNDHDILIVCFWDNRQEPLFMP
ncbi:type II toxin-antitoxin system RelE/ParE family toxin [Mucilaginibacter sp. AK015]|uniref:type II toxin-antitoxin system RelE/ParE family toxin n=1 Tax=Mucilaginibacter sp. AK015 TaxID=2723072 RepID=UPI00351C870E